MLLREGPKTPPFVAKCAMAINHERLEARREELKVQFEKARASLFALQGAIADLDFLLSEQDEESTEKE